LNIRTDRLVALIATIIPLFFAMISVNAQEQNHPWRAGATGIVITPPQNLWMGGYAFRKGPAEGTLQDLHAKVVAIEDPAGNRLVVVTLDLIFVTHELRLNIEKRLDETYGLPAESLLINASHTHCGPMIRIYRPPGESGEEVAVYLNIPADQQEQRLRETDEYLDYLTRRIVAATGEAIESLRPARLLYSKGRCGFAMNRRMPIDGAYRNSPNPDGPVDQEVPVLQVRDQENKLLAILFGYACHNTTLSVMAFNGDYAGYAQRYLEEDHPGVVAAFLQGCGGDQNPYPRGKVVYAERHGRSLAMAVEAAFVANPVEVKGELLTAYDHATLEYEPAPSRKVLEEHAKSKDRHDRRRAELLLKELDVTGELTKSYRCPIQVIRFGNVITMVTIGGEVCVDYSLRLKRELAAHSRAVWVCGYSNDGFGYVPSRRVLGEGGYEGAVSMRYVRQNLHPGLWAPTIEERIVGKVHELNARIAK